MPKVSIIVPVYNAEKYLNQCIESIIKQTEKDFELILINDGSKDTSLKICKEYEKKDYRIKVYDKPNGGVSSARNLGIEKSSGEWINFIDPDDWIEENMLETALNKAEENNVDVIQWNHYYNKSEQQIKRKNIYNGNINDMSILQLGILSPTYIETELKMHFGAIRGVWGKLYRSSIIKENNILFNEKIYMFEDGIFNLYVFEHSKKVYFINEFLQHYRRENTSVTLSFKEDCLGINEFIIEDMKDFRNKKNQDNRYNIAFNLVIFELLTSTFNRYFFHKDNFMKKREKYLLLHKTCYNANYINSIRNSNNKYLNSKKIIIKLLIKFRLYQFISLIYSNLDRIKKI